jgi:hypothetical protein
VFKLITSDPVIGSEEEEEAAEEEEEEEEEGHITSG